jgi:excisionase family DNA binding protein
VSTVHARGRVERSRNSHNRYPFDQTAAATVRDLLTTREVADRCRTSESTVRYWRHRGVGPQGYKVGRRVLYPADALDRWLREQHDLDADRRR